MPFSRGNHACSHDDGCVAGMFFSFSYRCFNYYYFPAGLRRSSGKEPSLRLGCKVTHIFRIGKELYGFSCPVSCFFSSGGRQDLPIRRPFTANQYRLRTDSATLLQHETDVTAAAVSVYGDRRTGITTAATHACDGRRTPNPESRKAQTICHRSTCLRACLHHESAVRPSGCKTFGTTLRVFSKNVVTLQAQEFDNHKLFIQ